MPSSPSMSPEQARDVKRSGWAGVLALPFMFLVLFVVFDANTFPRLYPYWGESGAQIAAWFTKYRAITIFQIFVVGTGLVLLIWLSVGLTTYLEAAGRRTIAIRVLTPAAIATSVAMNVSNAVWLVAAIAGTTGHPASEELSKYTYELSWTLYLFAQIYLPLLLVAAGIAFLQTRVFPAWAAWCSFVIGGVGFLGILVMLDGDGWLAPGTLASIVPWMLFSFWMVGVGTALLRIRTTASLPPRHETTVSG